MGCSCEQQLHDSRLVVLTGGPGAGKTAVLEIVRRTLCRHIVVLPEAATVLFAGGFPRHDTDAARRSAQDAIFHVQRAMETMAIGEQRAAVALCDRGTLDGLAYWPGGLDAACHALGIDRDAELARYRAVIHLRTPPLEHGYNHSNPVRTESASDALALGAAHVVGATMTFRAVRGLTAEWLQRVVDCHIARNAARGHDVPEMPYCPLVPKGVTARVTAVSGGFAVAVRDDDQAGANEVLRRARALEAK